ncbi:hypothetical protein CDL15_Pgr021612 [Punica granatum]|nr:hypothetical protein CDL15_Pgr021612 [Punica granatum]
MEEDEDSKWWIQFDWEVVLIGYGSGLIFGVVIGAAFLSEGQGHFAAILMKMQGHRTRWRTTAQDGSYHDYSMAIINKGLKLYYAKILDAFISVGGIKPAFDKINR